MKLQLNPFNFNISKFYIILLPVRFMGFNDTIFILLTASAILEEIIGTLTEKGLFSGKYLQILFTDRLRHLYLKGNVLGNLMIKALAHKSQVQCETCNFCRNMITGICSPFCANLSQLYVWSTHAAAWALISIHKITRTAYTCIHQFSSRMMYFH